MYVTKYYSLFPGLIGLNSYSPSNKMQFLQLSAFMEVWQLFLPILEAHALTFQYRSYIKGADLTSPNESALVEIHPHIPRLSKCSVFNSGDQGGPQLHLTNL